MCAAFGHRHALQHPLLTCGSILWQRVRLWNRSKRKSKRKDDQRAPASRSGAGGHSRARPRAVETLRRKPSVDSSGRPPTGSPASGRPRTLSRARRRRGSRDSRPVSSPSPSSVSSDGHSRREAAPRVKRTADSASGAGVSGPGLVRQWPATSPLRPLFRTSSDLASWARKQLSGVNNEVCKLADLPKWAEDNKVKPETVLAKAGEYLTTIRGAIARAASDERVLTELRHKGTLGSELKRMVRHRIVPLFRVSRRVTSCSGLRGRWRMRCGRKSRAMAICPRKTCASSRLLRLGPTRGPQPTARPGKTRLCCSLCRRDHNVNEQTLSCALSSQPTRATPTPEAPA